MKHNYRRISFLVASLSVLAIAGSGISSVQAATKGTAKLQTVPVVLSFTPTGYDASITWGEAQGIFAKQGIALNLESSGGSYISVPEVGENKVPFGFGEYDFYVGEALKANPGATAIENYVNIPITGMVSQKPITNLHQLVGKTFGDVAGSPGVAFLDYTLQAHGISPSSVSVKLVNYSVLYPEFFQHKFFAAELDEPGDESTLVQAKADGIQAAYTPLSNFGLQGYGVVLFASNAEVKSDPTLVRKMATAMYESEAESVAHATNSQIVADYQKLVPTDTAADILATWNDFKTEVTGFGKFSPSVVAATLKRNESEEKITSTNVSVNSLYTNSYLPANAG